MNLPALVLFAAAFIGIDFLADKKLRAKYSIHKREGWVYRTVNRYHMWGEFLIIAAFVTGAVMGLGDINEGTDWISKYWIFIFIISLNIFRTFMEWKFNRESKEYIVQFYSLITFSFIFLPVLFIFF
ncbi:DUF4181 domain-containing protein [Bacillus sp. NEB1478]|uniref:DUF4181 domain-containing protein n=1 Tax=Bacillus sp. NEB1478 TaxID=3073816 RepID=UPI002873607F|nr:DUF4181 domain-containing protein [Bacillus sp. NEB1478]WNB91102.1 DUF4181 domain-containing protein [Bacillus sp. NEB1478]